MDYQKSRNCIATGLGADTPDIFKARIRAQEARISKSKNYIDSQYPYFLKDVLGKYISIHDD